MTLNVEKEIADLKRRVAEPEGSFSYITGQLREVHVFLHNNVEDRITSLESTVAQGFAEMRGDFGKINMQFDKLPGVVAEAVGADAWCQVAGSQPLSAVARPFVFRAPNRDSVV